MSRQRVLIVEDQDSIRNAIKDYLEPRSYDVVACANCKEATEAFWRTRPDAAICDYSLPDGTGLEILTSIKSSDPMIPVIILTANGTIELAVEALKKGAENFLTKPIEMGALVVVLERAIESRRNRQKQLAQNVNQHREQLNPFVGPSDSIKKLAEQAQKVAATDKPLLILGETGTGKTVLARWIHRRSPRCDEAFVDLNCASFSRELLESELFGHEKGAFTGAVSAKPGLFEVAHRGTVFLDEIGDVDPAIQPKLLKVLEDNQFRRLGEVRDRNIDVRLIAATHQDLSKLVAENKFRGDLYFRISTIPLRVPSLRERKQDIPFLAEAILEKARQELGRKQLVLDNGAVTTIQNYSWPGNIRELRNVLERAAILCEQDVIRSADLAFERQEIHVSSNFSTNMTLLEVERSYIESVLKEEEGRVSSAATRLGVPRSSLYQKIREFGITV